MKIRRKVRTLTGKKRQRTQTRLLLPDYLVWQVEENELATVKTALGKKITRNSTYWRDATPLEAEVIESGVDE